MIRENISLENNVVKSGTLFVFSGSSGAGKTTLVKALIAFFKSINSISLLYVVSYTTRDIRNNEVNGIDYHYVSLDQFYKLIQDDFFIEWSYCYGNYYGLPKYFLQNVCNGQSYLMILDRFGAQKIFTLFPCAILIFINAPSMDIIKNRLYMRDTDTREAIENRIMKDELEVNQVLNSKLYKYYIENDVFDNTVKILIDIIHAEI